MRRYDLAVIGGGTAGLVAARLAAGVGARTVLVERARTGGDCLWTGCVPSKSLLAAAELAHRMRTADRVGLRPARPEIDFHRVMSHVHGARATIEPEDSPATLRRAGVEVIEAEARFTGPGRLDVGGMPLHFRTALIATGSTPLAPAIDGLDPARVLTSETVWDLDELPERLLVLGGGPIGCELGQAFQRLGSRVCLVQRAPRLLAKEEPEAAELVAARLAGEGVDLRLAARAVRVEVLAGGQAAMVVERAGLSEHAPFDRVLMAAGRRPDTASLDLDTAGVRTDERGAVLVDGRLRTTAGHIYAAGDAVGALPFTHVAGYHARLVVGNALFRGRSRVRYDAVPWVTFTDPEVGRVGLTEAQARERHGRRALVRRHSYEHLDRAITAGEAYGFAKLVGDPRGRLVGATVAAPRGGEAIAELAAWVASGAKIDAVSHTVHAYPTFAEGPARAADKHLEARYLSRRVRRLTVPALALLRRLDRPRAS